MFTPTFIHSKVKHSIKVKYFFFVSVSSRFCFAQGCSRNQLTVFIFKRIKIKIGNRIYRSINALEKFALWFWCFINWLPTFGLNSSTIVKKRERFFGGIRRTQTIAWNNDDFMMHFFMIHLRWTEGQIRKLKRWKRLNKIVQHVLAKLDGQAYWYDLCVCV